MSKLRVSNPIIPIMTAQLNRTACTTAALLLIIVLSLLLANTSFAAKNSAQDIADTYKSNHNEQVVVPDAYGRDTPRSTVLGFISALGTNDYMLASNYINTSTTTSPTILVKQFKQALDAGGRFHPDLQINNTPQGDLTADRPPNQERVGSIKIGDKKVPLILERVVSDKGEQYWQFSNITLSAIPSVLKNTSPTLIERYTVTGLENDKIFGYQLTDLIAALVLTIISFILTYILVWLCYHLLAFVYSNVRRHQPPLPSAVILPLTIVIMALTLSEIMVYAGLSVALREPLNRFVEIASWVALTWLLLQMVDVVFTRAVDLSYKRNYIERVSVIGLMRKLVKAVLLIVAIILIFGNLGFDLTTGIAALGIGGLALALGAQKTIENLVGSVVVVADAPVSIGDYCKFETFEGTVMDVGIRSSRVRTLNRTIVTVPNGDFSSIPIENFAARDMFRFFHQLYIKRSTNVNLVYEMMKAVNQLLDKHHLTNQQWNQVYIIELRQDCYVIQLQAYIDATKITEFYDRQNLLLIDVLNKVEEYSVEHALPTQELVISQSELEHQLEKDRRENNKPKENTSNLSNQSDIKNRTSQDSTERGSTAQKLDKKNKRLKRNYIFNKLKALKSKHFSKQS